MCEFYNHTHTALLFWKKLVSVVLLYFISRECQVSSRLTEGMTVNISDYMVLPSGALWMLLQGVRLFVPAIWPQVVPCCLHSTSFYFLFLLPSQVLTVGLPWVAHPHSTFHISSFSSAADFNFIILNTLLIPRSFIWPLQLFRAEGKNLKAKQVLEWLRQML